MQRCSSMNERDLTRLRHMRDAGLEVVEFIQGKSRASLDQEKWLVRALSASIAIIGEAASVVSEETRAALPQIPWSDIVGMRHRLIHHYVDINLDRLWEPATEYVPVLLAELEIILPPEPDAGGRESSVS